MKTRRRRRTLITAQRKTAPTSANHRDGLGWVVCGKREGLGFQSSDDMHLFRKRKQALVFDFVL